MPWYFYGNTGSPIGPIAPGLIYPGSFVISVLPYTSPEPDGYLFCNGQSVLKNDYLDLFSVIGTQFGSANINEFNVPDMRGRFLRGITAFSQGVGSISGIGGTKTHNHTTQDHAHTVSSNHSHSIAAHSHSYPNHTHDMRNHTHGTGGTAVIQPATSPGINSDTEEAGVDPRVQCIADNLGMHDHGGALSGFTGGTAEAGNSTTSAGNSVPGSASVARNTNNFNLTGATSPSGATASSFASHLPPFLTVSFLIKT